MTNTHLLNRANPYVTTSIQDANEMVSWLREKGAEVVKVSFVDNFPTYAVGWAAP